MVHRRRRGDHAFAPDRISAAFVVHVWAIGGIGGMTLAMMTRVTLGHTGRPLAANAATQLAYAAILLALLARLGMELLPSHFEPCLHVAAGAWVVGFASFIAAYAPLLLQPMALTARR